MNVIQQFQAARRVGVPILSVDTPDPEATIRALTTAACKGAEAASQPPVLEWDCVRGLSGRTETGRAQVGALVGEVDVTIMNPVGALQKAGDLPERSVLFVHLSGHFIREPAVIQAAWNLRDRFKGNLRTLVLLSRQIGLPAELQDDVISLDEPLPDAEQLRTIVSKMHAAADLAALCTEHVLDKSVEALRGLSAFAAEQVTAMSLTREGLRLGELWERKRRQIEQTPALKVFRDGGTFDEIGGCEVVKTFLSRLLKKAESGERRAADTAKPCAIVFIDEIEKMLGGAKGDLSGITQDQLGILLSYMQDQAAAGMIFVGPPGAAKSAIAKAAGNEGGIPTIQLDLGAAKGSLVGQSEGQIRNALKVVTAVSNGRSLWIATCNAIADLPPELRRRFTLGTFFFDLPDAEERQSIWEIHIAKYFGAGSRGEGQWSRGKKKSLDPQPLALPPDDGWTGAEIRNCCEIAWRLGCTLQEAAEFIVPVSRSAADQIQRLRDQAEGRFLSASRPGVFRKTQQIESHRKLELA